MKKTITYFCILFLAVLSFGQTKRVVVEWSTDKLLNSEAGFPTAINMSSQLVNNNLEFSYSWKSSNPIDISSLKNLTFNDIDVSQLLEINKDNVGNSINLKTITKSARGIDYQTVLFNPIIKENGRYKKVMSFSLDVPLKGQLKQSRSSLSSTLSLKQSVLATGEWYRFAIDTTGVYKITPQFLNSLGINLSGVNANNIKIYGNGGKPLPLRNSENKIFDVPENPIEITGAEDGIFSGDDYILFYGRGTKGFVQDNLSHINPYSDIAYYYVSIGGSASLRIQDLTEPSAPVDQVFNSYDFFSFYEVDLINIGSLGRVWHGDNFDVETKKDYNFEIPNLVALESVDIGIKFSGVYASPPALNATAFDGDVPLNTVDFTFNPYSENREAFFTINNKFKVNGFNGGLLQLQLEYDKGADPSSEGFLDFITISTKCQLKGGRGKQFGFSNSEMARLSGVGEFVISEAQNINKVWNVTDPYQITKKNNSEESNFRFKFNLGEELSFVSVVEKDLYEPTRVANSRVINQNLKGSFWTNGTEFNETDYLIIAQKSYMSAAKRLADFRRQNDDFKVRVIALEDIYAEFSTGKQDIAAIRNFIKYVYDNGASGEKLRFLCLMGDGSYDYKDIIRGNTNDFPLYHSLLSNSFINSYSTDDFYGFMDNNEGLRAENDFLDIAVGRVIAPTLEIAQNMVDKVIRFYDEEAFGDWRNKQLYISDDIDARIDRTLQSKLDEIAEDVKKKLPNVNVEKLFADAFVQQVGSGGERYPQVRRAILDGFESGVSYVNYFGHGGEDGISAEVLLTATDAQSLSNRQQMPVFSTFTCELTRFDNPLRSTAGEFMYWNPNGGAIALMTTTRELTFGTALSFNDQLNDVLFGDDDLSLPVGEALRLAKINVGRSTNKRAVYCIGDPAIQVPFPKGEVNITEINGVTKDNFNDLSLKALDNVTIKGEVLRIDPSNARREIATDYNGEVSVVLFDKEFNNRTLGNDKVRDFSGDIIKIDFIQAGEKVFRGLASVERGIFEINFIMPRNIRLPIGEGKISCYAKNNIELENQTGSAKINIGGLNTSAIEDTTPPVIGLFLNNESFVSGQSVNDSPILIANFSDLSGINTAGGVGHDILLIIDNDERNPIILNDFYSASLNDFTKGGLNFKLRDFSPGEHTISLRASDVYNNAIVEEINFIVNQTQDFQINNVLNYPNPFVSYTEFRFNSTASPTSNLETSVQIMTVSGKVIKTINTTIIAAASFEGGITWDGKDDFGNKIGKGVYVYKLSVKDVVTNNKKSKFEKLVIL